MDWYFIIENNDNPIDGEWLFWSNENGWVDRENATQFTEDEAVTLPLPINGCWVIVYPGKKR